MEYGMNNIRGEGARRVNCMWCRLSTDISERTEVYYNYLTRLPPSFYTN